MTRPTLSIVTINLNNRAGLAKTLESVASQSWRDFELLLIDGGSTDGSMDLADAHSELITFSRSAPDGGIYPAQNLGLQQAKGKYILFLNSGDWLKQPDSLEQFFATNPNEDILYGDVWFWKEGEPGVRKEGQENMSALLLLLDTICHQVQVIRREALLEFGGYREDRPVIADYDFLVKALIQHRKSFRYLPVPLAVVDINGQGYQSNMADQVWKGREQVQQEAWDPLTLQALLSIPTLEHKIKELRAQLTATEQELDRFRANQKLQDNHPKPNWWQRLTNKRESRSS